MNPCILVSVLIGLALGGSTDAVAQGTVNFESPQARPVIISDDGQRLLVVNTPDHRLAVYSLAQATAPVLVREIPVGFEPVSVALRNKDEAWVVNHVSDAVSVVDLTRGLVVETIRVGDEPGDIVFAGRPQRAFVSLMTDRKVQVIDPVTRRLLGSVPVFGDDPRALLASSDGQTVWVAMTRSGNGTTVVPHTIAPLPPLPSNPALPRAPRQGIIVSSDDPAWKSQLNVTLPDYDVVEIDVATLQVRRNYPGVGTILFQMASRPGTDELWVANTHARNLVRFEPAMRGHVVDNQVTRIVTGATPTITPINLNPGVDYTKFPNLAALATALAQPTDIAFAPGGQTAYVAAFGTDRIGVLDSAGRVTARIEIGNTPGSGSAPRSKRGPRGLAHHPTLGVLYVLNRLSNSLSVVDTAQRRVVREISMFDPTPKTIREGRGFLYDAKLSSAGNVSCASCHVDGRHDGLAWDLGNPGGQMFGNGTATQLHPMKGPLLTQTLQGLRGERMFHWRADRPGLATFNATFPDLLGGQLLSSADLATFVSYMEEIRFMPNPHRNLDDTLPTTPPGISAKDGETIFRHKDDVARNGTNQFRCSDCHFNASGTGSFGFNGLIGQSTKVAQLRGLYKRGGRKPTAVGRTAGFGYGSDGSKDDLPAFLSSMSRFNPLTGTEKTALESFLLAFSTGMAPAVGFARTVTAANVASSAVAQDLNLLVSQAGLLKCDLVVRGTLGDRQVGFAYNASTRRFDRDRRNSASMTLSDLKAALQQSGSALTFLGVTRGNGRQFGIDRNVDGVLDGDESGEPYGSATPSCATVLRIAGNSTLRIGNQAFAVVVSGAPTGTTGWFMPSGQRAQVRVVDLDLLVDLNSGVILPVRVDGSGEAVIPIAVPNDPRWIGVRVDMQAALIAPCGQLGVAASPGLELTVLR